MFLVFLFDVGVEFYINLEMVQENVHKNISLLMVRLYQPVKMRVIIFSLRAAGLLS